MGANYAFNGQWTLTIAKRDKEQNVISWEFLCGCGHESEFTARKFIDPYEAAVTAMEFHRCD